LSDHDAPVLLTGATGFIGQHLHRFLLNHGQAVRVLVRAPSAARARLDRRCEVHVGELTDVAAVSRALDGAAGVVYAAGTVRGRCSDDFQAANVSGVATLVDALGRDGGGQCPVVLVSSLAASRPELSDYARSKRDGEEVLRSADALTWTILRPPAVYGPGDAELRGLLALARRGLAVRPGPPGQRLALLHVTDLVRAVAACLAAPAACRHGCYAVDDGKPAGYDWDEIGLAVAGRQVLQLGIPGWLLDGAARLNLQLAQVLRYAPMLTPGKVRELQQARWLCDNSAFTQATGWQPEIDLTRGAAALFEAAAGSDDGPGVC
jgi:nucleoside-diphosphate-sugar epimerase